MGVRIIIDSTVDLPASLAGRLDTVPLTIQFGEESYEDGVTITREEFYEKLIETDTLPKTSQAAPAAFEAAFERAAREGDEAVVLTVSSKLSGTWQSAMIAASGCSHVHVVDTQSVAIGSGILAQAAVEMARRGESAAQIAARLEALRSRVRVVALLDTLEYLKRGGRISRTVAFAGELLAIKPVVGLRDGEIQLLGKARGSRQGNNLLVKEIEAAGGVDFSLPVLLGYTGLSDQMLKKYMSDSAFLWKDRVDALEYTLIGSTVGTHVGPGAVAVAFFAADPEK